MAGRSGPIGWTWIVAMADQLLTAAMVHVFALAGFAAGIATLWAISRACRAARNGRRWCWRRCAHG